MNQIIQGLIKEQRERAKHKNTLQTWSLKGYLKTVEPHNTPIKNHFFPPPIPGSSPPNSV
jgi:hypothetical protein